MVTLTKVAPATYTVLAAGVQGAENTVEIALKACGT